MTKGAPSASMLRGLEGTFQPNLEEPVHRWYKYTEGFSAGFVRRVFEEFDAVGDGLVLDPFGGCGTTSVEATLAGIPSVSVDVNPFLVTVTGTKCNLTVDPHRFSRAAARFLRALTAEQEHTQAFGTPSSGLFADSGHFSPLVLGKLLAAQAIATRERDLGIRGLLLLAVYSVVVEVSNFRRGPDLAAKDKPVEDADLPALLGSRLGIIGDDLASTGAPLPSLAGAVQGDARRLSVLDLNGRAAGLVVTSPPYLNGTNYIRNTKLELWFAGFVAERGDLRRLRDEEIVGGINAVRMRQSSSRFESVNEVLKEMGSSYDPRIPAMVVSYFDGMCDALARITTCLKRGGHLVMVIGDSAFGGVHVPTDVILGELAELAGLRLEERRTLRARRSRSGFPLRESVLIASRG